MRYRGALVLDGVGVPDDDVVGFDDVTVGRQRQVRARRWLPAVRLAHGVEPANEPHDDPLVPAGRFRAHLNPSFKQLDPVPRSEVECPEELLKFPQVLFRLGICSAGKGRGIRVWPAAVPGGRTLRARCLHEDHDLTNSSDSTGAT